MRVLLLERRELQANLPSRLINHCGFFFFYSPQAVQKIQMVSMTTRGIPGKFLHTRDTAAPSHPADHLVRFSTNILSQDPFEQQFKGRCFDVFNALLKTLECSINALIKHVAIS